MAERNYADLKNADVNLNQYWDDSSQINMETNPWWTNQKYTWEWVLNSNLNYDKNLTTPNLDPNYKYWRDAQMANSNEAGYIARRNDNIASALYNEWKRSKEDVVSFLGSQNGWNDSSEVERFNTVESIWKRIWDIQQQEDKNTAQIEKEWMEMEKKEEPKGQKVDANTFLQGTTTELFGKMITWADTAPYDHNSIEWKKAEARLAQYEKINAMSVSQIASSLKWGGLLSGGQAMRDLQMYNPEKYQMLQEYQAKENALDQINMIASGKSPETKTLDQQTGEAIENYLKEFVANSGGGDLDRMDLDTALSQNQWLLNYAERMSYYQAQINQIDQTISNLAEDCKKELQRATGENVPDYMIQNMVNNRSKKLYKQRDNLMNQYNYYKWVYEAQVEEEATKWEREYKERQLALQEAKATWDQEMDKANMEYKYASLANSSTKWTGAWSMRTERHNNPTAMTTDVAKTLWLVEWVDYTKWDPFVTSTWATLYTANFLWDPIETTIKALDTAIANWKKAFYTDKWGQRWSHTAMSNDEWNKLSTEEKRNVVLSMLQREWGDINKMAYYNSKGSSSSSNSNSKDKKVYTNDELYTQLRWGKIKYSDFLKNWNGDEPQEEVDDWLADKYLNQVSMIFKDDMIDAVSWLSKMLWDDVMAEMYALDHISANKNIKNNTAIDMVNKYVTETNKTLKDADKISMAEYLSIALDGRFGNKDDLKKALKEWGVADYKKISKEIWNMWNE